MCCFSTWLWFLTEFSETVSRWDEGNLSSPDFSPRQTCRLGSAGPSWADDDPSPGFCSLECLLFSFFIWLRVQLLNGFFQQDQIRSFWHRSNLLTVELPVYSEVSPLMPVRLQRSSHQQQLKQLKMKTQSESRSKQESLLLIICWRCFKQKYLN